ncbi:MAG: hypothetical protein R6V20_00805 [Desulfobia sp.]
MEFKPRAVEGGREEELKYEPERLILDGQQRLTDQVASEGEDPGEEVEEVLESVESVNPES